MTRPSVLAGRYRLDQVLGAGAMGRVWLGYDLVLERPVAVKQMHDIQMDASKIERAMREARAAGALQHPNVVAVHDLVMTDGLPWVVMEYVRGRTLDELVTATPLPIETAVSIGGQVAAALAAAHRAGIVHRDVKPANIMVDDEGRARLTDFGIARLEASSTLTATGSVIGTVAYMSPEVALGEGITSAADMWSLGATLFAVTHGRLPFDGDSAVTVLARLLRDDPRPPSTPDPAFNALLGRLLERDPGRRPSAAETAAGLETMRTGGVPPWAGTVVLTPSSRSAPRRRLPWVAGGIVGALAVAGVTTAVVSASDDTTPQTPRAGASSSTPTRTGTSGTPSVATSPRAALTTQGTADDAPGDGFPDVRTVTWNVTAAAVDITASFVPDKKDFTIGVELDVDDNAKTGCGGDDFTIAYVDYIHDMVENRYRDCDHSSSPASSASATVTGNVLHVVVPRSELPEAAATLRFRVRAYDSVGAGADNWPNAGRQRIGVA